MALLADGGLAEREPRSALQTSVVVLVLLAGLPVLAAVWALLSTKHVLSHEMTWDFLYNLSGAWHLQHGHVAHLDFHEPVGQLNFVLTQLGFALVGPTPFAFLAGVILVTVAVFASATLAAMRRLPLAPAVLFVIFASLLVLMPANVGDQPNAYSFAMSYNRYGWSLLSVLALILFLPPSERTGGDGIDAVNAGLLLTALFYLKVTYFAGGLALLGLAVLVCPHVRVRLRTWVAVGGLVVANALAPWNHPYLFDLVEAARAGAVRSSISVHLNNFFASAEGYAPYAAGLVLAVWLWARDLAPPRLPLAVVGILVVGAFVLSQNHQSHGLPLGIVIAFLLYDQLRARFGPTILALPLLMIFPLFAIAASALSLAGYHARANRQELLQVVDRTQLKGLAVPAQRPGGMLAAFADGPPNPALLSRARVMQPRFELTPAEYVETLLEAATLLQNERHRPGGIVVLDQVNPLPFMLGWPPPSGGNLWSGWATPIWPAGEVFAEADYVLIPKFSTYSVWTERAQLEYGGHLDKNFPTREETRSWIVLSRGTVVDLGRGRTQSSVTR